jgi:hypothetical protein
MLRLVEVFGVPEHLQNAPASADWSKFNETDNQGFLFLFLFLFLLFLFLLSFSLSHFILCAGEPLRARL